MSIPTRYLTRSRLGAKKVSDGVPDYGSSRISLESAIFNSVGRSTVVGVGQTPTFPPDLPRQEIVVTDLSGCNAGPMAPRALSEIFWWRSFSLAAELRGRRVLVLAVFDVAFYGAVNTVISRAATIDVALNYAA